MKAEIFKHAVHHAEVGEDDLEEQHDRRNRQHQREDEEGPENVVFLEVAEQQKRNQKRQDQNARQGDTEEFERVDGLITDLSGTVESLSAGTVEEIARVDADIQELAQTTASEIAKLDDKIDAVSATTTEEIGRIDAFIDEISGNVETLSASTVELAGDVAELSAATESGFTAAAEALEAEIARATAAEDDLGGRIDEEAATRAANDLVAPADYPLTQEGTELLTNGGETITITVDENFFNFGEIIEGGRN